MKGAHRRKSGKGAFELIEEATQLLRTAPVATLSVYYLGAIPFVLGFLYFWVDMSRSPFANQHLAEAGLGVTVLFLWMKFCQALFARRLRAQLAAEPMPRWTFRQSFRVLLGQAILQPSGLFLIPLSLIPLLPFPWTYSFYQNVTVLADADSGEISKLIKPSWKQASLWPFQNHLLLSLAAVFAFYVFLNWAVVCFTIPGLLKMLFGMETVFTQSPWAMVNTTFFSAICGLTYLSVDPILKTIYVLRCFYGESLQSGEDLKAELKRFSVAPQTALLLVLLSLFTGFHSKADEANPPVTPVPQVQMAPAASPVELDQKIDQVIHERKYTWRMPREKAAAAETKKGPITRFFENVGKMVRDALKTMFHAIEELMRKWFQRNHSAGEKADSTGNWISSLQTFLFVLVAVVLSVLAIFLLRVWRARQKVVTAVAAEAIQPAPDLADENVNADQLPEDGWTKLGRELLERGEFRLAMRAFYLATLAHLAGRNLISIAQFKSNRDYEKELRRRGHAIPSLLPMFNENLSAFERIWYGMHPVDRERVTEFAANVDKIKSVA